jgi:hypothetical protein
MKKIYPLLVLLTVIFIAGCIRPYPLYNLIPAENYNSRWLLGSEYVTISENDIIASVAYLNSESDLLVFDMEVINASVEDILVTPEIFYYNILASKFEDDTLKVMAIDPEKRLMFINKALSRQNASLSNQMISNIIMETTSLIGDVADPDDKTPQEQQLDLQQDMEREVKAFRDENRIRNQINALKNQQNYWASEVLRRTTLKPGDAVRGKIFFPAKRDIKKLQLVVKIEDHQFDLVFDQQKF